MTKGKKLNAVMVGAPNCGKSTLFNRLTHAREPVGNRAGVTVAGSTRMVRGAWFGGNCPDFYLTDLPGIRSLEPSGGDEEVTCAALASGEVGLIINVLSATSLERCLRLSMSLHIKYPDIPMICAVNMCDELERQGIELSDKRLSELTGLAFIGVSAVTGAGIAALKTTVREAVAAAAGSRSDSRSAVNFASGVEFPVGTAGSAAFAARAAAAALSGSPQAHRATDRADSLLTKPAFGIPAFFAVAATVFWLTFGLPGNALCELFERIVFDPISGAVAELTSYQGIPVTLRSLINDCLLGGVGAVISFLPRITLLFVLLSLLEDSGYMARASFIMDAPLRRAGLSGRAFIPVLLGFGCSVSAIMATRTIADIRERERCALFLPLVSCSARAPLYSVMIAAFFSRAGWLAALAVYVFGVVVFLMCTCILHKSSGAKTPLFITELPRFRMPRLRVTFSAAAERTKEFFVRAGGIILISSAIVWLLSSFTPGFEIASSASDSLLAKAAGLVAPVFSPLGFGDWRAAAALLCGLGAKEGVVSAFGVLLGGGLTSSLRDAGIFNCASALAFTVFTSMYFPCAATVAVMHSETRSWRKVAGGLALMLGCAYVISFVIYRLALNILA